MAQKKSTALVIQNIELTEVQKKAIGIITPKEFIRERVGKGSKKFKYVETGYVVARLNQAFGPLGWNFTSKKDIVEPNEVAVLVELTFKASNGYEVTKSQWGQAQRHSGVALGDTLKAATSDGLKKAASLAGVALDVYWPMLDTEVPEKPKPEEKKQTEAELVKKAKQMILEQKSPDILLQWLEKITSNKAYSNANKVVLKSLINSQLDKLITK